jgi:hypothetical protein
MACGFTTHAQGVLDEGIQLDRLLFIQKTYGSDSVGYWIEGIPIWLLDEGISLELALYPDSSHRLNRFTKSLGQNVDNHNLAHKFDEVYRNRLKSLLDIDYSKELIPFQDDRLILALLNQSSIERMDFLRNELEILFNIRDSIHAVQPNFFRKFSLFFKGFDKAMQNKQRIEFAILKTYYQLNSIDSLAFPNSIIKKQSRKVESWRSPYNPTRFSDKTNTYDSTTLDMRANTITSVPISDIRGIESYLTPRKREGERSWVRKIIYQNAMILVYGVSIEQFGGCGEIILVRVNDSGFVEYEIIEQWR